MSEMDSVDMLHLATDGRREVWLDFTTGRQLVGITRRPAVAPQSVVQGTERAGRSLQDVVVAAVEEGGSRFTRIAEHGLVFPIKGEHAQYGGYAVTDDDYCTAVIYCGFQTRVPAERRPQVGEAITRANYGLRVGGFELDYTDGDLRYRIGMDLNGGELTVEMARNMIGLAVYMCDHYHDALMRVMFAGEEAAEAIERLEGGGE
jgi:hypothetical protein